MHEEIFETLRNDHEKVKDLLSDMMDTSEGAPSTRDRLAEEVRQELIPHMRGEEQGMYEAMKRHGETKEKALEAIEEHHIARVELNELQELSPKSEAWKAKLQVLSELIHHHILEEENEMFGDAKKYLSEEEMKESLAVLNDSKQKQFA